MKLHIVVTLSSGYAREDAPSASLIGVYTNPRLAEDVRKCSMDINAKVMTVELDRVPKGVAENAELFNIGLSSLV